MFLFALGVFIMAACSDPQLPKKWSDLRITKEGLVQVEKGTDENGFYVEYSGISREDLLRRVSQSLIASGYAHVSTAFDGKVIGFIKGEDKLAVKIDQFGDTLYLAIFNEKGKEPLLHGVVFGKYTTGPPVSGDKAKGILLKELREIEKYK